MKQFDHPHIIKLIGVCMDDDFYIVMELAAYGEVTTVAITIEDALIDVGGLILLLEYFSDEIISSKEQTLDKLGDSS